MTIYNFNNSKTFSPIEVTNIILAREYRFESNNDFRLGFFLVSLVFAIVSHNIFFLVMVLE